MSAINRLVDALGAEPGPVPSLADGSAWEAFCDRLKEAGSAVLDPTVPADDVVRAEGYRYLLMALYSGLVTTLHSAGREHPAFVRYGDDAIRTSLDCPDGFNLYWAFVRDDLDYRICGRAGTERYVGFQLVGEGPALIGRTLRSAALHEFEVSDDGTFEISLSPRRHEGNWLELLPGTRMVFLRQFQYDWDSEEMSHVRIERVGSADGPLGPGSPAHVGPADGPLGPGSPLGLPDCLAPVPTPGAVRDQLAALGDFVGDWASFRVEMVDSFRRAGVNVAIEPELSPAIGGNLQQVATNMYFKVGADEALVIELEPPRAHYWSVCLGNAWYQLIEYSHHQTSLNGSQAGVDADGRCRFVLAHGDPGVANWLDPAGHTEGVVVFRWLLAEQAPLPSTMLVPRSEIDRYLPAGTARVTPQQRQDAIERRVANVARRFALPQTTRWASSTSPVHPSGGSTS